MLGYVKIYIYTTVVLDHTFPGYAAFTCAFSSGSKAHSVKENFLGINVCSFFNVILGCDSVQFERSFNYFLKILFW